ncbi:hypothetical protein [Mycobacterium sp. 360MFTsu5.1]|uniref:hypothetical protein n=1 Tax=Mycobacterium sp. 360MFTsu5.1 TaxID=1172186 RepID=UPI00036062A1|nr:hypothetical protein [Mycobacterium sp. 360MFTsu5.1]
MAKVYPAPPLAQRITIALQRLRDARADGDANRIHYAARLMDQLLDRVADRN